MVDRWRPRARISSYIVCCFADRLNQSLVLFCLIQEADPREVCSLGKMAFITFRGLSLHRGKTFLNVQAKWWVYETAWQMYSPNVECKTRKWHESFLVIFCVILTWIYSKLTKIQKTTEKCPVCEIDGLWLKDVFRKDQYKLHFTRSLLSNIRHYFFVVLNSSFCSHVYFFSSLERGFP